MTEWFSAAELAKLALPDMPRTRQGIDDIIKRELWTRVEWNGSRWRPRAGRGGGVEFHFRVLPMAARVDVVRRITAFNVAQEAKAERSLPSAATIQGEFFRAEMWARWSRMTDKRKNEGIRRAEALRTILLLTDRGTRKGDALDYVAGAFDVSKATIYNWEAAVRGYHRMDWMAALVPNNCGSEKRAAFDDAALAWLKVDWLRLERPAFEDCWGRLVLKGKEQAWALPSKRTAQRRLHDIPRTLITLGRQGEKALEAMYPAQQRDRSVFHALEAVNIDGHKWDVFVRYPDGKVERPMMVAIQDLYSGKFLGWRFGRSESQELIRLCIGDVIEAYGIFDHFFCDNGRGFTAKWLTGGVKNRYRFKVNEDDPVGILPQLDVAVHFCRPFRGQSKPIERGFRDVAQSARHPAFAGAWTGNSPEAKPENCASRAVPIDEFLRVANEIMFELNARGGRTSAVCKGRSFDQVFAESYAASPIRKASLDQQRLWLMCAEPLRASRRDGSITLEDNRFWHEALSSLAGEKLVVRFDPQALHDDLHVYRLDGTYVCAAPCVQPEGFADVEAGNRHGRNRRAFLKAQKALFEAERNMSISDLANALPKVEPAPLPAAKIVRLVHGANALAAAPALDADEEVSPGEELMRRGMDLLAAQRRAAGGGLRLVEDAD